MEVHLQEDYAQKLIAALESAKSGKSLSAKGRFINVAIKLVANHTVK